LQVTNVRFFKETQAKLDSPALDYGKKRQLRTERVKDYIRERPVGTKFRMMELMAAAGFDPSVPGQYTTGFGFIKGLHDKDILEIEHTPSYHKTVTILGEATTVVPPRQTDMPLAEEDKPEGEQPLENKLKPVDIVQEQYRVVDVDVVRKIEAIAKQFAWETGSDSVREFVKWIK